ncbi:MAG: hypothetical protein LQ342_003071 [Letrouitia transgressa]|nr:MAG: hypothetical protein LQ342_003071 [Letrouitia transgressa]
MIGIHCCGTFIVGGQPTGGTVEKCGMVFEPFVVYATEGGKMKEDEAEPGLVDDEPQLDSNELVDNRDPDLSMQVQAARLSQQHQIMESWARVCVTTERLGATNA